MSPEEEVLVPTLTVGEAAVFAHQMASAGEGSLASRDAPRATLERLGLADLWDTKVCLGSISILASSGKGSPARRDVPSATLGGLGLIDL
eukprot:149936-Pelagomonas_calceolata.AAC.5